MTEAEWPARVWARAAGALWVVTIATGVFAEYGVRGALVVRDDIAGTLHNIASAEPLWRMAFAAEFAGTAAYAAMSIILYALLRPAGKTVSLIAAVFAVIGCTIGILNLANHAAPLVLSATHTLSPDQVQALSTAFLKLRTTMLMLALTSFGVQLLLAGTLIARSSFFPRLLGLLLMIGGAGYLTGGFANMLALPLAANLGTLLYVPGIAAEALFALWLLLAGVTAAKWKAAAATA